MEEATKYLRECFDVDHDHVAVFLRNSKLHRIMQRISPVEYLLERDYQDWLDRQNKAGWDVYISMNTLKMEATGRTKDDIDQIRHVYVDVDHAGEETVDRILRSSQTPAPSYVLNSSPGRYQVLWRMAADGPGSTHEGRNGQSPSPIRRDAQEAVLGALAGFYKTDPAATDCSRVLRVPGYLNHKYDPPFRVTAERLSDQAYRLEDFKLPELEKVLEQSRASMPAQREYHGPSLPGQDHSRSGKDWAYAMRSLQRGMKPEEIMQKIAAYRSDKPDPEYYARTTVQKAVALRSSPSYRERSR